MHTWDAQRAAAWLRRFARSDNKEAADTSLMLAPFQAEADAGALADAEHDALDIAGWPALVAPFYD